MKKLNLILFTLALLTMQKCTVSYGTNSGGSIPEGVKTFSVLYFENRAPLSSGIASQAFTEDLKDVFINQTKLNLEKENGDLSFEGYISDYKIAPISIQAGNESSAAKNRFTMAVKVTYINNFDDEKNFERTFSRFVDFDSNKDFSSIEDALLDEVNEQLTQDIFNASIGDW